MPRQSADGEAHRSQGDVTPLLSYVVPCLDAVDRGRWCQSDTGGAQPGLLSHNNPHGQTYLALAQPQHQPTGTDTTGTGNSSMTSPSAGRAVPALITCECSGGWSTAKCRTLGYHTKDSDLSDEPGRESRQQKPPPVQRTILSAIAFYRQLTSPCPTHNIT